MSILGNTAAARYSPVEVVKVERTVVSGMPDVSRITTPHIESQKDDSGERFVAVLEIPPVVSPETAVKVAIVAEVRGKK
jgi:hypothetical protein